MAKSFRKITTWLLGVLTCVALVLGFISTRPEVKASAETTVTFSSVVNDTMHETYGLPIRFNTSVLAWDTYHNWVNADAWKSISDYTAINGKTVTEINAATSSTQKITLMMQPAGNFSFLRLYVPTTVMAKEDLRSVEILDGWSFNNGKDTYTAPSVEYSFYANQWIQQVKGVELATEVTKIITYANRTDGGTNENFVLFQLSNNDYAGLNTKAITSVSSLYGYIDIDGKVLEAKPNEPYFNVWGVNNTLAFRAPGLTAAQLSEVEYITIKAGAKFPSYATQNGGEVTYYVTQKDVTFIHDVPKDTWTRVVNPTETHTVTFMVDGATYTTQTVNDGGKATAPTVPTKAADENYTYTFKQWTLNGTAYNFSTAVTSDITLVAEFTATEKTTDVDISNEISFAHQDRVYEGTETYILKTNNNYWTKNPKGGCLNEHDPQNAGGGQEQMKYIYLNGVSLYDINKNDNGSYGSKQANIVSGGIYAPILVTMGSDQGKYSYIQMHVPTGYPNEGATANENHQSFELKAGFSVTENGTTYIVTKDFKWVNINGTWVDEEKTFSADEIEFSNPRIEGNARELYRVDIISDKFNITCNDYDFMYDAYTEYRKYIFINGVSVYDINMNIDDSDYVYSTYPMIDTDEELFSHPVFIETHKGSGDTKKITLWMHKDYLESLKGDVTISIGAGYSGFTTDKMVLTEDAEYSMTATVYVDNGTKVVEKTVLKGSKITLDTPKKAATETETYVFEAWYIKGTNTVFTKDTVITADIEVVAKYTVLTMRLIETSIDSANYYISGTDNNDRWLYFTLTEHDYPDTIREYNFKVDTIKELGLFDKITLKGKISLGSKIVEEATLAEIGAKNGYGEAVYMNLWGNVGSIAFRALGVSSITSVVVEEGARFPSYQYHKGESTEETYYMLHRTTELLNNSKEGLTGTLLESESAYVDIRMATGAAVRISSKDETSGIRFEAKIAMNTIPMLKELIDMGRYEDIKLGVVIVPTDYLMGGQFTMEWLEKNGYDYINLVYSLSEFYDVQGNLCFPKDDGEYYSFFGTIGALKKTNYDRDFSGIAYVLFDKEIDNDTDDEYIYAKYDSANKRSASYVANAALNDRETSKVGEYKYYISENNNYSRYKESENEFVKRYIVWTETSAVNVETFSGIQKGKSATITPITQKLAGPYVELVYSTDINVWGEFTYTDGSKTAKEDFYLQAGTTNHKQFLDVFRVNGVGYGMDTSNLSMVSIKFTNAELEAKAGTIKILGLYSEDRKIDTKNQEIYLTVPQKNGGEITVGAHLGLGGALTYLAKSGIYEGVVDQTEVGFLDQLGGYKTKYKYNTGRVVLKTDKSFDDNHAISKTGTEAAYYGHATSSKAADGAVNLINNYDAGRQIQQSWYAAVGGDTLGNGNGSNGYTRAFCKTESPEGKYWPYNPVQAGDVVSNPGQIIDYDINLDDGYIYVKARAMDWAKGRNKNDVLAGTIDGGVTTKSYMENYYRLSDDGTLTVNNAFIDWNGFTDMELCGWASTELPAVYPVQTLNYYVTNTNGDGTWTDVLEYNNGLAGWTGDNAFHQFANPKNGPTMVEHWFAWANGGDGNAFGMGVYIPNIDRLTSGRSVTSTALGEDGNRNAVSTNILKQKGLMSNMQEIKYTYQSAYVGNTSYTAPGIDFRMEAYKPIEYSYVICLGTVNDIRATFKEIEDNGTVTNAGGKYQKVGLDAWARADKIWTW